MACGSVVEVVVDDVGVDENKSGRGDEESWMKTDLEFEDGGGVG